MALYRYQIKAFVIMGMMLRVFFGSFNNCGSVTLVAVVYQEVQ